MQSQVRVLFEPSIVSYCELCDLFWERLGESRYLLNQVRALRASRRRTRQGSRWQRVGSV